MKIKKFHPFKLLLILFFLFAGYSTFFFFFLVQRAETWVNIISSQAKKNDQINSANRDLELKKIKQNLISKWLAKRYRVAETEVVKIVEISYMAAKKHELDPHLILSIIAIESSFNPYAESVAGAQGLMQIMPRYHQDKLQKLEGTNSALPYEINIMVGAQILREYLDVHSSLNTALLRYVGVGPKGKSLYPKKVLTLRSRMDAITKKIK